MTTVFTDACASRASAGAGMPVPGRPGHIIVALHGDLDITTAPALRDDLLDRLHPSGTRVLILDLSDVSFCDAAGLAPLVGTLRRAILLDITLRLAAPGPQVTKMLHITGLDRNLTVYPTPADALIPPQPAPRRSLPIRHRRERVPAQPVPAHRPLRPRTPRTGAPQSDAPGASD